MYSAVVTFSISLQSGLKAIATSNLSASSEEIINEQVEDFKQSYSVLEVIKTTR